ncbi:MAG TPA: hypothetical protein VNV66_14200, partial [Pilimelia sp.]|nr:hypothetical protein [Pilimelia sp.]
MRVVRTILGILLLTVGLPLVLAGGGLWVAMQHRDAGGAFTGALERITTSGHAVVVADVDALLRAQAPMTRSDRTRLRITGHTAHGPAFLALAPAAAAENYLAGVAHTRLDEVKLTRGALPVRTRAVPGQEPAGPPAAQRFWLRSGTGAVEWSPAQLRGQQLALVVTTPDGRPPGPVELTAELRPGWLNSTTWGLLILGTLLVVFGIAALAWPQRTREVVYVVEPGQVPDIAARLGVSLPEPAAWTSPSRGGPGPVLGARPASLGTRAQDGTGAA